MSILRKIQDRSVAIRIQEEALYEAAMQSYEDGEIRKGLWAKALIESGGDSSKAESIYLRLLVAALKDELYVASRLDEEATQRGLDPSAESPTSKPRDENTSYIARAAEWTIQRNDDFKVCEDLIHFAGGHVERRGSFFSRRYDVRIDGKHLTFDSYQSLGDWIRQNLPLKEWASRK